MKSIFKLTCNIRAGKKNKINKKIYIEIKTRFEGETNDER